MLHNPATSLVLLSAFALLSVILPGSSHALAPPAPPKARPVIVGTSDYANILFGKLQRAAALWGTNLGPPTSVVVNDNGDKVGKLNDCLWKQFYMASPGSDGTLSKAHLVAPLSNWVRNDLQDTLLFFDTVSPKEKGLLSGLPSFFNSKKPEPDPIPSIDAEILQCAVERKCAHIYALANTDSLQACYTALYPHCQAVPCTIVALQPGVTMQSTAGWCTSRPQNMEGEFVGPVALQAFESDEYFDTNRPAMTTSLSEVVPTEDVCEVMMHIALRTDRTFADYPRVVTLSAGASSDKAMAERLNQDYFTKTTRQQAGTVLSVASWENFLSPLGGLVNAQLGVRPDQQY